MGPQPPKSGGYIAALDGLRGLAILLVLLHHFAHGGNHNRILNVIFQVNNAGWSGVDLFFVLSGFLITGILLDAKGSPGYFRNFYARRILRICPLYYGSLFVISVLAPLCLGASRTCGNASFIWLWLYGQNLYTVFYGTGCNPANVLGAQFGNFWSLAVEEHFYLVWPLLVAMLPRRALMVACMAVFLGSAVARSAAAGMGVSIDVLYSFTLLRLDGLALGGLVAAVWRDHDLRLSLVAGQRWVLLAMGAGVLALFLVAPSLDRSSKWVHTIGFSWLALFFAALLVCTASSSSGWWHGVMTNTVMRGLGKYSYGIYVYHSLLSTGYAKWFGVDILRLRLGSFTAAVCVQFLLAASVSFVVAWLSWQVFEHHFLSAKRFFEYRQPVGSLQEPVKQLSASPVTSLGGGECA